jgi:uncharacterized protein involved in outer membrane biogenesis
VTGTNDLYVGGTTWSNDDVRDWIPFVINIPRYAVVSSAILRVVAAQTSSDAVDVQFCCEAADNASAPASQAALFAKALTTAKLSASLAAYTAGNEYSYNITNSVQEILNRSGWAYGNTMAVMIVDNGTLGVLRRQLASFEHATYAEPKLDITFTKFVPRGGLI